MRAIAIIPVVINHVHSDWLPGGGIGVGIFFGLSGFLIAGLLLEEPIFNAKIALRFILRRFARIYPTYVVAIALSVIFSHWSHPERTIDMILFAPTLLTFTDTNPFLGYGFAVLWTLKVEMWFYVSLPFAMLILGPKRGVLFLSAALLAAMVGFVLLHMRMPLFLRFGGQLAFGSLLALAWKSDRLWRLPANDLFVSWIRYRQSADHRLG
jgi:peptidoglycan/LPS O-acetylase OafA/YrhL